MVTWQPPITPNGIIRSYQVKITNVIDSSGSGSGYTSTSDDINHYAMTTSVVITMLEISTTYQVQVFANTVSEGDGSDVILVTTKNRELLTYSVIN